MNQIKLQNKGVLINLQQNRIVPKRIRFLEKMLFSIAYHFDFFIASYKISCCNIDF